MKSKHKLFVAVGLMILSCPGVCLPQQGILVADFDGLTFGNWKVMGTAFGSAPAQGSVNGQMEVSGFQGRGFVNSFHGGDGAKGTLSSPPFVIRRPFLNFLLGGGKDEDKLAIRLRVGGKIVCQATGPNSQPGGSERLDWSSFDVRRYRGQSATLEIVDNATGGWGHITVDNITQSDISNATLPARREMTATQPLLLFPVKNGGPKRNVTLSVAGRELRNFDIELADGAPDWWAPLDLAPFQGQHFEVRTSALPFGSLALSQIRQSQTWPDAASLYNEPLRGQLHFSSKVGWLNDPNGLVYSQGEYHLFYQHNPYGWAWGNMHWGHAVSPDLVHWSELPIALYPHSADDMVYSGSAVLDKTNSSGWKTGANDLLVAAYTSTKRGECIAYSNDKGHTWTEYAQNPVVKHRGEGRDPRLLWHEPTHQWVMVVWSRDDTQTLPDDRSGIDFYTSPDMKHWTFRSRSGGFFECPDLFELPLEDGNKKWVLTAADTGYRIGTFDGKKFQSETPKLPGQQGRDLYAAQTWSDEPKGRRVQIGWFRTETHGMPFNQSMSLPCQLALKTTPDGPRLTWTPVRELEALRAQTHSLDAFSLSQSSANPLAALRGELVEVRAEFTPGTATEIAFNLRGVPVVYDAARGEITVGDQRAPAPLQKGKQSLTIYLDRTGIEVYMGDGLTFVPLPINVNPNNHLLSVSVKGGTTQFRRLDVYELQSAWKK